MNLPNYPTPEVKAFGEKVMDAIFDASIQNSMGGLGGCPTYNPENFDADVLPYVEEYLKGNNDALAITYAAMITKALEEFSNPTSYF